MQWDLFCRVIDNHGDLGVCWRLATALTALGEAVRLRVDDASALAWMAPGALAGRLGVEVLDWRHAATGPEPGDVVVEAFGCDLPEAFVHRMTAAATAPVWINLEYLSAQDYVARSHGLASPQHTGAGAGLVKWFFYPGFTRATGGLLGAALKAQGRHVARAEAAAQVQKHLVGGLDDERPVVFLFCYRNPALAACLAAWRAQGVRLMVPPGWPAEEVGNALGISPAQAGRQVNFGRSTARFLPFGDQAWFDAWLQRADVNFVRGEDSWVRALWAGKPFVWQPYVQADGAHRAKLDAFLRLYLQGGGPLLADEVRLAHWSWNTPDAAGPEGRLTGGAMPSAAWRDFAEARGAAIAGEVPDLAEALLGFALSKR